ncbi:DUF6153 family protein [Williamsia sp. 1135]|uniref:DUF6153 family protein n=1 Tax=Williamsia sp. 1135 TaxID=1889262 RepID=UPI00117C0FBE|nr:DUF6153 family protein [Williamsia sp. 1135]
MSRTSARLTRTSAALFVVLGVLLLHSLPMTHSPGGHGTGPGLDSPAVAEHRHGGTPTAMSHPAVPVTALATMSSATDHTPGMAMGMCMAVVTIVATLLLIRHLAPDSDQNDAARSRPTRMRRHQSRAPPWAGPSLEKLSILRI